MNRLSWGEPRPDGPRKGRWTPEEIAHLKDWYGLRDIDTLARDLSRRPKSVRRQADKLFRHASRTGPWTAAEVADLKRYLGLTTQEVISRILGRDEAEVRRQIFELGRISRDGDWSREDRNRLKRLYGSRSDEDLALVFTRPVESIRRLAEELHLAKDKVFLKRHMPEATTRMPRWSEQSLAILRKCYPHEANIDIATRLGRSVKSIVSKAHHLGLRKEVERLRQMGRENISLRYEEQR